VKGKLNQVTEISIALPTVNSLTIGEKQQNLGISVYNL